MSHPIAARRTRRAALVAGLVALLVAGPGLTGPGYAASARDTAPCEYGGYAGDATISFEGTPAVGAPVTATFHPGSDWTSGATARVTWSGTGYGGPVRGATFTPRYDLVGATTHATVQVTGGGSSFTAQCDLGPVAWGSIARPAAPRVTGDLLAGHTLHAAPGDGDALPPHARYHFEWFSGTSAFATGTDVRLTAAMAGRPVVVKTMVTSWGYDESAWSPATTTDPVALEALARPGVPVITGTPVVDGMLHATPAPADDYPHGAAYEYDWLADGVEFATSRDAVLGAAQLGARITVRVRAIADGYSDSPWSDASAATDPVAAAELTAPSAVAVDGVPAVGRSLAAAVTGSWTPGTQVTYSWKADGIPFGTDPTVVLTNAQLGKRVTVALTGTRPGYTTRTVESAPVGPVTGTPLPAQPGRPTISGTPQVGQVLTAHPATTDPAWPVGATYHYEWYAGTQLLGTDPQLTLGAAHSGATITVRTRVTAPGYLDSDWSPESDPTTAVAPGDLSTPSRVAVTGVAQVGRTLTATTTGSWPDGTTVTYRWLADGRSFGGSAGVVTLGPAEVGAVITVQATGVKAGYASATITSEPTAPVRRGRLSVTRPEIRGATRVGRTLHVVTGEWTEGTRFTYQWFVGGTRVRGATGQTLELTGRFRGKRVRVQVTGHLAGYDPATRTSAPTGKVR